MSCCHKIDALWRQPRGIAIVTVLAMVVILSLILVAFVTTMRIERTASFSYSQSVAAEQLAGGALNLIVNDLQGEMDKDMLPDRSIPSKPLHTNVSSENILPQLVGNNTSMPNLVKTSFTSPSFEGIEADGKLQATNVNSSAPATNGRFIDANRWSAPRLGDFPDDDSTPHWILMTRDGPASTGTFGATGATLNNSAPTNENFAIGRFAYAIYDVGGLLDVTVAGHPSALSAADLQKIKGTMAGARLTEDGFGINPTALISWRNAASSSDYLTYVTEFQMENADGTVYPGDNTFFGRQDLIKAAQDGVAGLSVDALPDLTVFSRDNNAPSWGPTFNASEKGGSGTPEFSYRNNANIETALNRFLPGVRFASDTTIIDYRLDGTAYTYDIEAGDPVVTRRFPLGRLDWIGPSGPQNGGSTAAIQTCFGLLWGASDDPELEGAPVWKYVGSTGTTPQGRIKTLKEVADERRIPNFFELLQAGILHGSLGLNGGGSLYNLHQAFPTLQILRIGAALIDQYDEDSYPTVIEYSQSGGPWLACGVESLPNVMSIVPVVGAPPSPAQTGNQTSADAAVYLTFNLWNPHRNSPASPPPLRLRVKGSVGVYNKHGNEAQLSMKMGNEEPAFLADLDESVELNIVGRQGFSTPMTITTSTVEPDSIGEVTTLPPSDNGVWVNTYPLGSNGSSNIVGLRLPNFPFSLGSSSYIGTETANDALKVTLGSNHISPFNAFVEFQSPSGHWIPYQFATGINDPITWIRNSMASYYIVSSSPWSGGTSLRFANFISYLADNYPAGWNYNAQGVLDYRVAPNDRAPAQGGNGVIHLRAANTWDFGILYSSNDPRSIRFNAWRFQRRQPNGSSDPARITASRSASENINLWSSTNTTAFPKGFGGLAGDPNAVQGKPDIFGTNYFPAQLARNNFGRSEAISETNNTITGTGTDTSYVDRDGLRRTADSGLFVDPSAAVGNPFEREADRPVMLNRPFRSVGEMGYAFRDNPWRSLDFFSSKSADSALLDLFSVAESTKPTVSGRINLNTRNPAVIEAVLTDMASDPVAGLPIGMPTRIAEAIVAHTASQPLVSKGELVNVISPLLSPTTGGTTSANFSNNDEQNIKHRREAFIRALADVGQTRTWNLMIDVIAQSGRYAPTATTLDQFVVEGERRYWLHVALDRFTGEVLDQRLEVVTE